MRILRGKETFPSQKSRVRVPFTAQIRNELIFRRLQTYLFTPTRDITLKKTNLMFGFVAYFGIFCRNEVYNSVRNFQYTSRLWT